MTLPPRSPWPFPPSRKGDARAVRTRDVARLPAPPFRPALRPAGVLVFHPSRLRPPHPTGFLYCWTSMGRQGDSSRAPADPPPPSGWRASRTWATIRGFANTAVMIGAGVALGFGIVGAVGAFSAGLYFMGITASAMALASGISATAAACRLLGLDRPGGRGGVKAKPAVVLRPAPAAPDRPAAPSPARDPIAARAVAVARAAASPPRDPQSTVQPALTPLHTRMLEHARTPLQSDAERPGRGVDRPSPPPVPAAPSRERRPVLARVG